MIYLWKLSNLALGNEFDCLLLSREKRLSCSIFSCATLMVIIFCVRLAFRFFCLLINGRLFKNLCRGYTGGPYGLQNNFLEKEFGLWGLLVVSKCKTKSGSLQKVTELEVFLLMGNSWSWSILERSKTSLVILECRLVLRYLGWLLGSRSGLLRSSESELPWEPSEVQPLPL